MLLWWCLQPCHHHHCLCDLPITLPAVINTTTSTAPHVTCTNYDHFCCYQHHSYPMTSTTTSTATSSFNVLSSREAVDGVKGSLDQATGHRALVLAQ